MFLDACTLVPSSLRDVLLRSAAAGLFVVHWSPDVLDEVRRTLVEQIMIEEERVQHLFDALRRAFPEAEISGYQSLMEGLQVDAGDRHVLAAAIASRADVIVTRNVRHFPVAGFTPFDIVVQHPDEFLVQLLEMYPNAVSTIVVDRADDLGDTFPQTLGFLRQHVPRFVERLQSREPFSSADHDSSQ